MSNTYNIPLIIIVGCLLIFAFYYFFKKNNEVKNQGALSSYLDVPSHYNNSSESTYTNDLSSSYDNDNNSNSENSENESIEIIKKRAVGTDGNYFQRQGGRKVNSYSASKQDLSGVTDAYEIEDMGRKYDDRYEPIDESGGDNTAKTSTSNKNDKNDKYGNLNGNVNFSNDKGNSGDKYDVDGFLPKQVEKDWFETIEPTNVKNSNLINIYRPIGVNTISSSHKNACRDIRGIADAVCPQFNVGPFLQSSIPPDFSYKSLC